jgi:hypothetical protein
MDRERFAGGFEVNVRQVIGILIILGAYGLTWYLMLRSMRIVKIIDRESLKHAGEIKTRLKRKGSSGARIPRSKSGTKES